MNHTDELLHIDVSGLRWPVLIRSPRDVADDPALIVNLGNTAQTMLTAEPYCSISNPFVEQGHYAVSYNLPFHGELAGERYGEGLVAISAAHSDGKPGFSQMADVGRMVVDLVIERGLVNPNRIYAAGVSRGGLSALHLTAGDTRVQACVAVAPVTHLPALIEWRDKDDLHHVKRENAMALVDRLAGRPLHIMINRVDERVDTARCIAFVEALRDADGDVTLELFDAEGHGLAPGLYRDAGMWLLSRV